MEELFRYSPVIVLPIQSFAALVYSLFYMDDREKILSYNTKVDFCLRVYYPVWITYFLFVVLKGSTNVGDIINWVIVLSYALLNLDVAVGAIHDERSTKWTRMK